VVDVDVEGYADEQTAVGGDFDAVTLKLSQMEATLRIVALCGGCDESLPFRNAPALPRIEHLQGATLPRC